MGRLDDPLGGFREDEGVEGREEDGWLLFVLRGATEVEEDEEEEAEDELPEDFPPPAGCNREGSARSVRENALLPWRCSK